MRIGDFASQTLTMAHIASMHNINANRNVLRLATAKRINQASDDPAGLAIAQKLSSQIKQYNTAATNMEQGMALLRTMDAAYASMSDGAIRLQELSVQYANSTLTSDQKANIEAEARGILDSIADSFANTEFNSIQVFERSPYTLGAGYGTGTTVTVPPFKISRHAGGGYDLTVDGTVLSSQSVSDMLTVGFVDTHLAAPLSAARGYVGATTNAMEHALNVVQTMSANATGSLAVIEDADMALESSRLASGQALASGALAMLNAYVKQMKLQVGSVLNTQF